MHSRVQCFPSTLFYTRICAQLSGKCCALSLSGQVLNTILFHIEFKSDYTHTHSRIHALIKCSLNFSQSISFRLFGLSRSFIQKLIHNRTMLQFGVLLVSQRQILWADQFLLSYYNLKLHCMFCSLWILVKLLVLRLLLLAAAEYIRCIRCVVFLFRCIRVFCGNFFQAFYVSRGGQKTEKTMDNGK